VGESLLIKDLFKVRGEEFRERGDKGVKIKGSEELKGERGYNGARI